MNILQKIINVYKGYKQGYILDIDSLSISFKPKSYSLKFVRENRLNCQLLFFDKISVNLHFREILFDKFRMKIVFPRTMNFIADNTIFGIYYEIYNLEDIKEEYLDKLHKYMRNGFSNEFKRNGDGNRCYNFSKYDNIIELVEGLCKTITSSNTRYFIYPEYDIDEYNEFGKSKKIFTIKIKFVSKDDKNENI